MNKKLHVQVSPADEDLLGGWRITRKLHVERYLYRYKKIRHAYQKEFLHRLVAKRILQEQHKRLTRSVRVKFRDGDVTNCTRENIVLVDYAMQSRLAKRRKDKSSKYRGVYLDGNEWLVKIYHRLPKHSTAKNKVKYRVEYVGRFARDKEDEAGRAYDRRMHEIDPTAPLNFPEEYADTTTDEQESVGLEAEAL